MSNYASFKRELALRGTFFYLVHTGLSRGPSNYGGIDKLFILTTTSLTRDSHKASLRGKPRTIQLSAFIVEFDRSFHIEVLHDFEYFGWSVVDAADF